MSSIFDYEKIEMPKDCIHKISPSQVSKFFEYPATWYKEQILEEEDDTQSTGRAMGSVCHFIYEKVGKKEKVDRDYIEAEIDTLNDEEVDKEVIRENYPPVAESVVNEYILKNPPDKVEYPVYAKVKDGIYVGGTIDNFTRGIVVDYKNVSTKPNTAKIPFNYKIQLLSYAYALSRNNKFVDRIRLVYGVRPTKTLPARTFVVTEQITADDWKLINDTLELIADTILRVKAQPELTYLLFKSMSLKNK